jgi:hypothetical protein
MSELWVFACSAAVSGGIGGRDTNIRRELGLRNADGWPHRFNSRTFPEWCHSGLWKNVSAGIQKGALVLQSKLETIRNGQGKRLNVGGKSFTGKKNLSTAILTGVTRGEFSVA